MPTTTKSYKFADVLSALNSPFVSRMIVLQLVSLFDPGRVDKNHRERTLPSSAMASATNS